MDIHRTKLYYDQLTQEDICECGYCRNYVREIRAAYPELADLLNSWGADIEKPLEVIPIGPADGTMYYGGAQYVVMGRSDDLPETSLGDVRLEIARSHPMTGIKEDHFVIEVSPISLKWTEED
ncbi:MAG: hypothetical protein J5822_08635 [Eubacteriaceae bacterium]|nr:hypothetical protein [Eubacteriaceae bacterium]